MSQSHTADDIPDPNLDRDRLYQDVECLPLKLQKPHFEEGLIYTMTLESGKKFPMLVMILETKTETFVYRTFFVLGSSRKTYFEGSDDKTARYEEVWRLAPRREMMHARNPAHVRVGETLRFAYGMEEELFTVLVTGTMTRSLRCTLQCGTHRSTERTFEHIEITNCFELFGSPVLQSLTSTVLDSAWEEANRSKSKRFPERNPELNKDFRVSLDEPFKRKWHLMKILGNEGVELLCKQSNARAVRNLSRSSSGV